MKRESLIGRFFHSYPNEEVKWQGKVLSRVSEKEDVYLVQLFEWLMGEPSDQVLVPLSQMVTEHWQFYSNREDWLEAYERYKRRKK